MSWRRLSYVALDKGVKGTRALQSLFKEICRPSACFKCSLCDCDVPLNTSCLEHACEAHPDIVLVLPTPPILWIPFSTLAKPCQTLTPCGLLNQLRYNFLYLFCTLFILPYMFGY